MFQIKNFMILLISFCYLQKEIRIPMPYKMYVTATLI